CCNRWLVQRQTSGQTFHLLSVERFPCEQRVGYVQQLLFVLAENRLRARVVVGNEALDFLIDAKRGVFAVILVLRDLAAREDFFFLLAEGQRAHRAAHAPLTDHAPGEVRGALQIVASAGGDTANRDLFGDPPAKQNRNLVLEILSRVIVFLVDRKLHRQSERHATR